MKQSPLHIVRYTVRVCLRYVRAFAKTVTGRLFEPLL